MIENRRFSALETLQGFFENKNSVSFALAENEDPVDGFSSRRFSHESPNTRGVFE